ncbi:ABC transporter ATP-binding protein [Shouchella sp. 1P09AA]|uniref:ABC transporter ATP-binding protein n=1 Tax=unclassified Shouchella TaxID=2893065 RepID=UPI0039A1C7F5
MNEQLVLQANSLALKNRLHPINVSFKRGTVNAICGGNGAGKTSLLSLLTGMISPSAGTLLFNGKEVKGSLALFQKSISYMPDHLAFPDTLTAREMLSFLGKLSANPSGEIEEMLEKVGLENELKTPIKHYSKGMQQRLNLAQCLLRQSSLIFMDEPTNGLDPYWVVRMKEMVEELKEQGKTIILSTHTLSFVEDLADSILFLQKGSLLIQSSLNDLQSEMKGRSLEQFVYETIAEKELGCKK